MTVYVINTYTAPSLLQPRLIDGLSHIEQKVTTDRNEAIQYAKNAIKEEAATYESESLSKLFDGKLGEKHEDDTLMRYSVGPREMGLYMMLIDIQKYEI